MVSLGVEAAAVVANGQPDTVAGGIEIDLAAERSGGVQLRVQDDGRGFDASHQNGGLGLGGMAERARLVGGRLDIKSQPGGGTALTLEVP